MKNCYADILQVKDHLFALLNEAIDERTSYLDRCQKTGVYNRKVDLKIGARLEKLSTAINLADKAARYLERLLEGLDSDIANIAYEDIDNMEDYDYTAV